MSNLRTSLEIFKVIKERLATEFDLAIDDEVVIDTAEGECDLSDVVAKLIREARYAEAQALGVKSLLADMGERMDRLFAKSQKLRDIAKHACLEAGLTKIAAPDFSVSISAGKPKVVTTRDPDDRDHEFYTNVKYTWNKTGIKEALEEGTTLDFAYFGNPEPVISVRGK